MIRKLGYWRRIGQAYLAGGRSNLTFWHETPTVNPHALFDRLGPYYMTFSDKADYPGPFDAAGVPQLDYRGGIGVQYNPIAIAQYGLAHYNRGTEASNALCLKQADWLASSLERNGHGLKVWLHHFDFDYRTILRAPWYSALAQGQGVSLLARARLIAPSPGKAAAYEEAMRAAYESLEREISQGGVQCRDASGDLWLEEYIVDPPTHVLNGFIWALWGVLDYRLAGGEGRVTEFFDACVRTLERRLELYDAGRWSLYELSGTLLPNLASPFYHRLHVVQLDVLHRMTGKEVFGRYARRWEAQAASRLNRALSFAHKCAFKALYY